MRVASLSLLLIATMAPALSSASCQDEWICVDAVREGGNVELRARNLRGFPITYTVEVITRYFDVSGPRKITRTLAPLAEEQVLTMSQSSGGRTGAYRYNYDWTIGDKDAAHDDDHLYSLPYKSGKSFRVVQGYGSRFSHKGLEEFAIDFDMPVGTPIYAARAGVVARVEESHDKGCWEDGCGKYANFIVVLHSDGTTGEYYHLMKDGALVEIGDSVARGQQIGFSGNTGHSTMPHLHFAVYRATEWGNAQSIPVRFQSRDGIIEKPRRGARYFAD